MSSTVLEGGASAGCQRPQPCIFCNVAARRNAQPPRPPLPRRLNFDHIATIPKPGPAWQDVEAILLSRARFQSPLSAALLASASRITHATWLPTIEIRLVIKPASTTSRSTTSTTPQTIDLPKAPTSTSTASLQSLPVIPFAASPTTTEIIPAPASASQILNPCSVSGAIPHTFIIPTSNISTIESASTSWSTAHIPTVLSSDRFPTPIQPGLKFEDVWPFYPSPWKSTSGRSSQ